MNHRSTAVQSSLNRAEFRWKWLKFLQQTSILAISLALLVLALGVLIMTGAVKARPVANSLLVLMGAGGLLAWMVLLVRILAGAPDRSWLAAAIERVDRRLLDRLNTLLFLEKRRSEPHATAFASRIARQAQNLMAETPPPSPFPSAVPKLWLLACLLTVAGTSAFYFQARPWARLLAAGVRPAARPQKMPGLTLPPTNTAEPQQAWGEVRITDPGSDLRVTKLDVVPLQIEAAANESLTNISWFSAVNGAQEVPHPLPHPAEARYAVYHPVVYLDELKLTDWDVLTYYAQAKTDRKQAYASEVYFVEVRPFREDILKMPGGEGGQAYQGLNEMSGLIQRQQHVIRQTHEHVQKPPETESARGQDRGKLADAEGELRDSTQHLYAKMAAEMENKPIGEALDHLGQARQSLDGASSSLRSNVMDQAQQRELGALSQLVAARKMFQKAVSDNPNAFQGGDKGEEDAPVADNSGKRLDQMAEFRNESKAAEEFVRKSLEQQRGLEQRARTALSDEYSGLAAEERKLRDGLDAFQEEHPQVFKGAQSESKQAREAMSHAEDALKRSDEQAERATHQATQSLEQLATSMQRGAAQQQLADTYKLKQMLDRQIQSLNRLAGPQAAQSGAEPRELAREARQTVEQLKNSAEQEPTRGAFGQPLRDALSGGSKADLDRKLDRLEQGAAEQAAAGDTTRQQAAEARDALGKVSKAFENSQPRSMQMAKKEDALKPSAEDSLHQGFAELESLSRELESGHSPTPADQARQGRQALADLQNGLRRRTDKNAAGTELLDQLKQMLDSGNPLEAGDLKALLEKLQRFSVENAQQLALKDDQPRISNIDPSQFPPAYRGRIQKYFQQLSEK